MYGNREEGENVANESKIKQQVKIFLIIALVLMAVIAVIVAVVVMPTSDTGKV